MRLVLIGDVGVVDDMIHIGDEAMFDEALHQLRQRGATAVTAISANPAETSSRYGVDAVARIGFSAGASLDRAADGERMRRVLDTARGQGGLLAPGDPAHAVIEAVRASDGVLVCGGGNMASTWPLHIFERATLGAVAEALGRPLVVSGQTIGPELTAADASLVASLLSSTAVTGLREPSSYGLCRELGVPERLLRATVDDASFVGDRASVDSAAAPYCAVTFSTHLNGASRDLFADAAARLLDEVALSTGLAIVFVAHFGSLLADEVRGDSVLHEAVAERMRVPSSAVVPPDSVAAAGLARQASLVVTSRYHPAVFAVSGGVPTIGIAVDDYTTVKLTGALGNLGQDAVLQLGEVLGGAGGAVLDGAGGASRVAADRVAAVWADRAGIRSRGLARAEVARASSAAWWDELAALLGGVTKQPDVGRTA
ncbi:polysaccharide pyruvyl transferase family protein [Herbiconiux sp. VKM Ac-1786]|uniref:polysaccharide pyruvyl transferase family protein n=1 Tax=Herbiconiux sp. VKM Ac-1786 TaxID=2783824 RepID=UPI00188A89AA|nr:polysaccharide pyruvyl transferase family protein [Herbiconiux sp. VKM Ac-1786]MBF4572538.1 polysaccharide pyruvyl transferase family protein [Herbiconiux sp. VKM Ac-1786]